MIVKHFRAVSTGKTFNRNSPRLFGTTTKKHIDAFNIIKSRKSPFPALQNEEPPFNVFQLLGML